jgi:hypothetical protein
VKDQTKANTILDQLLVGDELHDDCVSGVARWRIICGVNRARQRGALALVVTLIALGGVSGCQAGSSIDAAQTAIVAAQTVLPGAQATAQAGATLVSIAVANAQPVVAALQAMLKGVSVQVKITPEGAQPSEVTNVEIDGTDAQGNLSQVDSRTRQAAVGAALAAAQQYYPNATINLKVSDASGGNLINASVAPGQTPNIQ